MKVLRGDPTGWKVQQEPSALAVGVFDGIHAGHRAVLAALQQQAKAMEAVAGVVTFDPHPLAVVAPERVPPLLTAIDHRIELLEALGIELVAVVGFDDRTRAWSPAHFVTKVLAETLAAALVVVGEDFRFGRDRTGHVGLLQELGAEHGFEARVVPLVGGDRPVSSSGIRSLIGAGDVAAATRALGRPHEVWGTVIAGDGRGRSIGVPTANLRTDPGAALPAHGVYAVRAGTSSDESLAGVANIGVRPTFEGADETVEVHLLDTDRDLYGQVLRVRFVERIRAEKKFADVDALVAQIHTDIASAREVLDRGD